MTNASSKKDDRDQTKNPTILPALTSLLPSPFDTLRPFLVVVVSALIVFYLLTYDPLQLPQIISCFVLSESC
jgi:hypothetical protein